MSTLTAPASFDHAEEMTVRPAQGYVVATPKTILRVEGALALVLACAAYARTGGDWGLFVLLFLTPDLSMLAYLAGCKVGAVGYNVGHSYLLPGLLGAAGMFFGQHLATFLALIWVAHIGFDRMLGYGLKYPMAFGHTHLGLIGKLRHG